MPIPVNVTLRYFRLEIPILAGILWAWALLGLFPHTVGEIKSFMYHPWLDDVIDGKEPGFQTAVRSGLIGVFVKGSSSLNNVLWTMRIELIGSVLIYLVYGLAGEKYRRALLILAGLASVFVFRQPEYLAFSIGCLLREAVVRDQLSARFFWPSLAFGWLFGSMMPNYAVRTGLPVLPGQFALGAPHQVWHVLAAGAVLYCVLVSPTLKLYLASKHARFLGDISFGLYLVHVPMLYTLFVPLFLAVAGHAIGVTALLGLFVATSLAVGYAFTVLVDRPTLGLIRRAQFAVQDRRVTVALRPAPGSQDAIIASEPAQ